MLLDDPLSSLDATVAMTVFKKAIKPFRGTCIMVCSQLQLLPNAQLILVIEQGKMVESGTLAEIAFRAPQLIGLVEKKVPETHQPTIKNKSDRALLCVTEGDSYSNKKAGLETLQRATNILDGALIQREERRTGVLASSVYTTYLAVVGWSTVGLVIIVALTSHGLRFSCFSSALVFCT